MANEFKHVSVGTDLSQAEWESTAGHVLNSQATGDVIYASSSSQLTRLGIGSASQVLTVTGGIPAWVTVAGAETFFEGERTAFRANRRQVAQFNPSYSGAGVAYSGNGFYVNLVAAGEVIYNISGEPLQGFATAGASNNAGIVGGYFGGFIAMLSPNHSPRMLTRVQLPAASGNVTAWNAGFFSVTGTTANGAYLRIVTTGNVFFVTRQGASETATDLGALSRTLVLGFEIESTDAGVTWVCRNQAGTALATHTTNVPTASSALQHSITAVIATSAVPWGIASAVVEGTFA